MLPSDKMFYLLIEQNQQVYFPIQKLVILTVPAKLEE